MEIQNVLMVVVLVLGTAILSMLTMIAAAAVRIISKKKRMEAATVMKQAPERPKKHWLKELPLVSFGFLRKMASPEWNNWVLGIFWSVTFVLFFFAIFAKHPTGFTAWNDLTSPPKDPYSSSINYLVSGGTELESVHMRNEGTYGWLIAFGISLFVSLTWIPIAFRDEARAAFDKAADLWEQRSERIKLTEEVKSPVVSPQPATQSATIIDGAGGKSGGKFWKRFKAFLPVEITGEIIGETVEHFGAAVLKKVIKR